MEGRDAVRVELAWLDTSAVAAVWLADPRGPRLGQLLAPLHLVAANLMEAELRSVLARERLPWKEEAAAGIEWVHPQGSLRAEYDRVLSAGYLKGADLFHLAIAIHACPAPSLVLFASLDERQSRVAGALGFRTLDIE